MSQEIIGRVQYNESAVSILEGENDVQVECASGRRVRAKYVIGADGAKSTVRGAIGATFTGTSPEMIWCVIDGIIDTNLESAGEMILFQLQRQTHVMMIPRERGRTRFYVLVDGNVTQKNAEETVRKHMSPCWIIFMKVEWFSSFPGECRDAHGVSKPSWPTVRTLANVSSS